MAQDAGASSPYKSLWAFKKQSSTKSLKTAAERLFAGAVDRAVSNDKWTISLEANGVFVHFLLKTTHQPIGISLPKIMVGKKEN